jgi:hypothetical protein
MGKQRLAAPPQQLSNIFYILWCNGVMLL